MSYLCPSCNRFLLGDYVWELLKFGKEGRMLQSGKVLMSLTSRAEEVNTSKAYTDVNHIKPERWSSPWLMLTGMFSARCFIKVSGRNV